MRKIIVPVAVTAAAAGGAAALWLGPAFAGAQSASTTTTAPATSTAPAKDGPIERALAKLVSDGTLTRAQADKVAAALKAEMPMRRPGGPGGRFGVHRIGGLGAASTYLGMTDAELHTALEGGKTLAQVAESKGKSVSGLINAMVKEATDHLDQAVAAGKLTAAQAADIKADIKTHITDLVNNGKPAGPPGGGVGVRGFGPGRGPRPGMWGGPPPASSSSNAA